MDVQQGLCRDFCRAEKVEVVDEFTDPGISGTIVDRPGLQEMLSRVEEVDCIVVSNTSRLWRDPYPQALVIKALRDKGKDVRAVDEPNFTIYTDNDPNQFLVSGIIGVLDVWEKLSIVQRLGRPLVCVHAEIATIVNKLITINILKYFIRFTPHTPHR